MRALRSVAAVLGGLGFMLAGAAVGTGLVGALFGAAGLVKAAIAASLAVAALAGTLGGWLTARIAGYAEYGHAAVLAAVFAVLTVVAVAAGPPPGQPAWYGPAAGALGVIGILAGGRLRAAASAVGP